MRLHEIQEILSIGLQELRQNDLALLQNNVHEQSISHQLARYLNTGFQEWNVDCEYNRHGEVIKLLNGKRIRPDIIIHERIVKNNLLIIQVKKSNNQEDFNEDRDKIKDMTTDECSIPKYFYT